MQDSFLYKSEKQSIPDQSIPVQPIDEINSKFYLRYQVGTTNKTIKSDVLIVDSDSYLQVCAKCSRWAMSLVPNFNGHTH